MADNDNDDDNDGDEIMAEAERRLTLDPETKKEVEDLLAIIFDGVKIDIRHSVKHGGSELVVASLQTQVIALRAYLEGITKIMLMNGMISKENLGDLMVFSLKGEIAELGAILANKIGQTPGAKVH